MISGYYNNRFLWFRIFGWGLLIKDTRRHGRLFSERAGYHKYVMIGFWLIRVLKKNRL